jgi:hypothetical protein
MLGIVLGPLRAVCEDRGADVISFLGDEGILMRPERVTPDDALGYFDDTCGWFLHDERLTMTPRVASQAILQSLAPRTDYKDSMVGQDLPVEWALMVRTGLSSMALLGQLRATANWHRIAREWIYGEPTETELGQLEADFFARPRTV